MKRLAAAAVAGAAFIAGGVVVANETLLSDSTQLASISPGASFQTAYKAASPGDVITVKAGSYGYQELTNDPAKTSTADVVFDAEPGVTVAGISIGNVSSCVGAKHLTFQGMKLTVAATTRCGADDVTFRDLNAVSFNLSGGSNIYVLGGNYGPKVDDVNQIKGGVTNVLVEGAWIHNFTISDAAKHAECIHIWGAKNVTIRNNVIQNCTDRDIFAKREGGLIIDNVLVENNQLDSPMPGNEATSLCSPTCPRGGNSVQFSVSGGQITNSIIRNNLALTSFSNEGQVGVVMSGNVFSGFILPTNSGTNIKLDLRLSGTPPPTTTTGTATTTTTEPPPTTTEPPPTTTEPPPVDPDRAIFCSEFVPSIQGNSYYGKWSSQNPGELGRWTPYRDGVCVGQAPAPPAMTTLYGKALVAAGRMT